MYYSRLSNDHHHSSKIPLPQSITTMSKSTALTKLMESNHKTMVLLRCKIVLVGDSCVGKSAATQVFLSGGTDFPKNYMMVYILFLIF